VTGNTIGGFMKTLTTVFIGLFFSLSLAASSLTVAFNQKTYKYHYTSCSAAKRCTVNCIDISLKDAIDRGGIPCKLCHPPAFVEEE
jgi:hypothetical protein